MKITRIKVKYLLPVKDFYNTQRTKKTRTTIRNAKVSVALYCTADKENNANFLENGPREIIM